MVHSHPLPIALLLLGLTTQDAVLGAELQPKTLQAWTEYVRLLEARVEAELSAADPFLVLDRLAQGPRAQAATALRSGQVFMTRLPGPELRKYDKDVPDGLIHHWLGVARIPGARVEDVLAFVQRYDEHAAFFDDVVASKLVQRDGDLFEVFLKLRRKKIVTVTYNTTHDVLYRGPSDGRASSRSIATRIAELQDAGEKTEREKPIGRDSGYLWRLNSYWRFQESDGGVTIECESVTLSRDIPFGFGWLVKPMVESVSRESLERTLASIRAGVLRTRQTATR